MLFNLHLRPNEPSHTGTLHRHSQHDVFSLHTVLSPRAPACETSPPPCHTHPLRLPRNLQTDRSPPQRAINHNVIGVPVPTLWHNLVAQCSCVEKKQRAINHDVISVPVPTSWHNAIVLLPVHYTHYQRTVHIKSYGVDQSQEPVVEQPLPAAAAPLLRGMETSMQGVAGWESI